MKLEPTIYKLIESENFRKRTAMFISYKKITVLRGFIDGYYYALDAKGLDEDETNPDFGEFNDWIANYYQIPYSTAGWTNMILDQCRGDEEKAVDEFFRLYDLFMGKE